MRVDKTLPSPASAAGNNPQVGRKFFFSGNTFVTCVRLVDGRVAEAWSTGRMLRNMNVLLQGGVDAQGMPQFVQQAHCLCNDGHALAATRALEDLAGVTPPRNALLVRSLVQALRGIQEHLLHVYQFHLSDWVCLETALRADPAQAARLVQRPGQGTDHFCEAQERVRALAQGQGGDAFGGGGGAHPDYRGEDAFHLALHAHALESLQTGALLNTALALLGCSGVEGFSAYHLGGLPDDMDLGGDMRRRLRELLERCRDFVRRIFLPDLELLARAYGHWADRGAGPGFLSWGDFITPHGQGPLFPGGVSAPADERQNNGGPWELRPPRPEAVVENKEPHWNALDRARYRLHPGTDGPSFQWGEGDFHWLSAPRYDNAAREVGSLARVLGAWTQGGAAVCGIMNTTLENCGLSPAAMNSTLGRVLSRGIESSVLAQAALEWLDELDAALAGGDRRLRTQVHLPFAGLGTGRVEVPRGTLVHTVRMEEKRIVDHDYLIPTLWNFSPRDADGGRGPLERALLGTPVADSARPLEILRTVHALDPCNACLVVLEDFDTGRVTTVNA